MKEKSNGQTEMQNPVESSELLGVTVPLSVRLKKKQIRYLFFVVALTLRYRLRVVFCHLRYLPSLLVAELGLFFRRQLMRLQLIKERMKLVAKYGRRWRLCVGEDEIVEFLQLERDIHKRVFNRDF